MSTALVPVVHARNGVVFANSRDVAAFFEKQHKHVLRDIDALATSTGPDLGWFHLVFYQDAKGETRRAYVMTKDGFALLVMGYTGDKALRFKLAYIAAFNDMEAQLRAPVAQPLPDFSDPVAAARAWADYSIAASASTSSTILAAHR